MASASSHSRRRSWISRISPSSAKDAHAVSEPSTTPTNSSSSFEFPKRWSTSVLTDPSQQLDSQANQLIHNALERTISAQQGAKAPEMSSKGAGSFSKMSFSSMMGFSGLSLTRTSTNNSTTSFGEDKEEKSRGRSVSKMMRTRSSSQVPSSQANSEPASRSHSRARSQSPFNFRRFLQREPSPPPQPVVLNQSDTELSDYEPSLRPRTAFTLDDDSDDETVGNNTDNETEDEWTDDEDHDMFDPVTERNTERNALIEPENVALPDSDDGDADPLGEGVNVVVPPEPYFPSTLNYSSSISSSTRGGKRTPRRRKSVRHPDPLPLQTSRPIFQRDRCTIILTQGDPEAARDGRKVRRYVVASDMSEESRYAVEWGIGTVLRDGDEMLIVTVVENEDKGTFSFFLGSPPFLTLFFQLTQPFRNRLIGLPESAHNKRYGFLTLVPPLSLLTGKSGAQRQGMAYILVRQATSLLQRTRLHVKVSCQAWHAKNARHMLLGMSFISTNPSISEPEGFPPLPQI